MSVQADHWGVRMDLSRPHQINLVAHGSTVYARCNCDRHVPARRWLAELGPTCRVSTTVEGDYWRAYAAHLRLSMLLEPFAGTPWDYLGLPERVYHQWIKQAS